FVYVGEGFELENVAKTLLSPNQILVRKYSYLRRLNNTKIIGDFAKKAGVDLIYNFGPIIPRLKIPQVVRSVYSNLYYPEIDFWNEQSRSTRLKKNIIDKLRLKGTLAADGLIFENKGMQGRVSKLYGYDLNRTLYVEPSVSV